MFVELNSEGMCATPVNDWTTIYLKVFPPTKQPLTVNNHDVPILTFPKEDIDLSDWDLTTQQVYNGAIVISSMKRYLFLKAVIQVRSISKCLSSCEKNLV